MIDGPGPAFAASPSSQSLLSRPSGLQSGVGCEDAVLDAFYAAIPEEFGTRLDGGRHATIAASDPLCPRDRMWLRGIAAAIAANHWQPIQTAPKDEYVLIFCPNGVELRRCHVDIRLAKYDWRWAHCRPSEQPTHWMSLPEDPA